MNCINSNYETAFSLTIQQIQEGLNVLLSSEILQILIDFGADPNTKDHNNWAPIHLLARQSDALPNGTLLKRVLNSNLQIDLNIKGGTKGWTPLHIACYKNNFEAAQILT